MCLSWPHFVTRSPLRFPAHRPSKTPLSARFGAGFVTRQASGNGHKMPARPVTKRVTECPFVRYEMGHKMPRKPLRNGHKMAARFVTKCPGLATTTPAFFLTQTLVADRLQG